MNAICEDQQEQHGQDDNSYVTSPRRVIDSGAVEVMEHRQDQDAG